MTDGVPSFLPLLLQEFACHDVRDSLHSLGNASFDVATRQCCTVTVSKHPKVKERQMIRRLSMTGVPLALLMGIGLLLLPRQVLAGGGYSVYIWNCSHPSYGWQRSGTWGEHDVSQATAQAVAARRAQSGPSYERYQVFRATSQRVSASAPSCSGSSPNQYCVYYAKLSCWGRTGWLGGYRSLAECRYYAELFRRYYGCAILGYASDCR